MKRLFLLLLPVLLAAGCRPSAPSSAAAVPAVVDQRAVVAATALLPAACRPDVIKQMSVAGDNAVQLVRAILDARPGAERDCVGFLLANMPERDLGSLTGGFLLENIRLALEARAAYPWRKSDPVSEERFLDDVLPYANVNEARDPWRAEYRRLFFPLVRKCATVEEAVKLLNSEVFKLRKVAYHATKRKKPDQSPAESEACGYASCTGLSVMLVDACRAVGIPARVAGTPQWNRPEGGNHTWVEVWTGGRWRHVGAFDPSPFDKTWFDELAAKSAPANPATWVYAVSFRRTGLSFPMVWAPGDRSVSAMDVSAAYRGNPAAMPLPLALEIPRLEAGAVFAAVAVLGGEKYQIRFRSLQNVTSLKEGESGMDYCISRCGDMYGPSGCWIIQKGKTPAPVRLRFFQMDADARDPGRVKVCAFLLDAAGKDHYLGTWSVPAPGGTVSYTLKTVPEEELHFPWSSP